MTERSTDDTNLKDGAKQEDGPSSAEFECWDPGTFIVLYPIPKSDEILLEISASLQRQFLRG